jgi:hypothetical protein
MREIYIPVAFAEFPNNVRDFERVYWILSVGYLTRLSVSNLYCVCLLIFKPCIANIYLFNVLSLAFTAHRAVTFISVIKGSDNGISRLGLSSF